MLFCLDDLDKKKHRDVINSLKCYKFFNACSVRGGIHDPHTDTAVVGWHHRVTGRRSWQCVTMEAADPTEAGTESETEMAADLPRAVTE